MRTVPRRARDGNRLTPSAAFGQGVVSDLANPKMAVFFASLLPQFVPPGGAAFASLLLLGAVFASLTFAWLTFYAVFIAKIEALLWRPSITRLIEGFIGIALIGLGARIAAEHR